MSRSVVAAIGKVTFLEVIRDKVLYNIFLCAALLFGAAFLASRLMISAPERVVVDFGVFAMSLSSVMVALFTGAGLLGREFERRTIYVALSRPISRIQFVVGKFAGLLAVLALNWLLLCGAFLLILWGTVGGLAALGPTLLAALFLIFLQSMVIAAIAILFSSFSTTSLAAIITIGLYLAGTNVSQLRLIASRMQSSLGAMALNGAASVIPNMEHFNLGLKVTYGLPVSGWFVLGSLAYALVVSALSLLVAGILVARREA